MRVHVHVNIMSMETMIIHKAIDALAGATGALAEWGQEDTQKGAPDGKLRLNINQKEYWFDAVVKKQVRNLHLANLNELGKKYENLILITEVVYPNIGEQLRSRGVNYIDALGNVFIKQNDLLLLIEGKKPTKTLTEKAGRAFNKTGLKFIYHLLTDKDFIGKTYREKAAICDTAVGNINYITNDLLNQGFLRKKTKGVFYIPNREKLINQWLIYFERKLKPDYFIGTFRFVNKEDAKNWRELTLDFTKTKWGGEPAAGILTNYLKPVAFTMYTAETRAELIRNYKLVPDEAGNVRVYNVFWAMQAENAKTVHPLIIFADLVNTANARTDELANMIYNEYLKG